jgi:hypothetical protein
LLGLLIHSTLHHQRQTVLLAPMQTEPRIGQAVSEAFAWHGVTTVIGMHNQNALLLVTADWQVKMTDYTGKHYFLTENKLFACMQYVSKLEKINKLMINVVIIETCIILTSLVYVVWSVL